MADSLAALFCRVAAAPAAPTPALERLLDELVTAGRAAWPRLSLDSETFVRHLARLHQAGADVEPWLRSLHVGELYLTCACAQGDGAAIAAFDSRYLSALQKHLAHLRPSGAFVDDVRQQLREKLFVTPAGGDGTARPKVAEYAGLGPLENGWLRVVTMRIALDMIRRHQLPRDGSASVADRADSRAGNPELDYLQKQYRSLFQECLAGSVQALDAEQRNLLRMHVVDGVTLDQLAAFFHFSRATVVRRIAAARASILEAMRARVHQRLPLGAGEFESLMGLFASQLDLSLSTVL